MITLPTELIQAMGARIACAVATQPLLALSYVMFGTCALLLVVIIVQLHRLNKKEKKKRWH